MIGINYTPLRVYELALHFTNFDCPQSFRLPPPSHITNFLAERTDFPTEKKNPASTIEIDLIVLFELTE